MTLEDKFVGCIVGTAVGDALGVPMEFVKQDNRVKLYGSDVKDFVKPHKNHPLSFLNSGQYSDDTQLTITLAQSLIDSKRYYADDFARKLLAWHKTQFGSESRAPGNATMDACNRLSHGVPSDKSGVPNGHGCGSAMRVSPIGLFYFDNEQKLIYSASKSSDITHRSSKARYASAITAKAVAIAVDGNIMGDDFVDSLLLFSHRLPDADFDKETYDNLLKTKSLLSKPFKDAVSSVGDSWLVTHIIPLAVLAFAQSPNDFERTVSNAANYTVDADSVAAIAGAISGAYNGFKNIPKKYSDNIENRELLIKTGKDLFKTRN